MNKKVLKYFYLLIVLFPFIDLVTSLITKFNILPFSLGVIVRGLILFISVVYILFFCKTKYRRLSILYLLICFIFLIFYCSVKINIFSSKHFILDEVIYLIKYFFFPIVLVAFYNFFEEFKPNNRKIFRILQINLFVYCFLIVLANVTNTSFATYLNGYGNSGWFYAGNEIGIIIALLFPIIFRLINKSNSFLVLIYVLPIIYGIEIIGTKTSMLGLLLPSCFFFFYYLFRIKDGKSKQFLITFVILFCILISCSNLPVVNNIRTIRDNFSTEKNAIDEDYSNNVTAAVLFSDRDYYLKKIKAIYKSRPYTEKMFGIGFVNRKEINNKNIIKLIEMDYYDIFYRFGIIGFIVYFLPLLFLLFLIIRQCIVLRLKFNFKQLYLGYVTFIGLAVAYISGHVFGAPGVSSYLIIHIVLLLYYLENSYHKILINDKKITILALHLGVGGVEKYISDLCKMLENDYEIDVISTYKMYDKPSFNFSDKVKITYLINDCPNMKFLKENLKNKKYFSFIKIMIRYSYILLCKYLYNIYAIENINSKYIISTRYFHNRLVSLNKNRDIIAIATEHNSIFSSSYVRKVCSSCENIDYLVCVSEELCDYYSKRLKNTKCIYISNVVENIPVFVKHDVINNKLISIGRLSSEKGFIDLIKVIEVVKKDIPNIVLDIYGDGVEMSNILEYIKGHNLDSNVNLLGFVDHEIIMNSFCDYDAFVMTSFVESFGIVLVEAMSHSLPAIAMDSANGACSILKDGNGILVKDRNIDDYAKEVVGILSDIDYLNDIALKGYNSSLSFDIDLVKEQWLNLLNNK